MALNNAVFAMGDYTLRRTDVNDAADRAHSLKRGMVIDSRLGDPTAFGFKPYKRYMALIEQALKEPRSWSYTDARGLPELREALGKGNPETGNGRYTVHPDNVFVGCGISGVARSLFGTIIESGDEVVIPKWSYILYFAEAALAKAKVVDAPLARNGEPDIGALSDAITSRTKAVFITTVGNPLGVAMRKESFCELISAINRKEREFGHPIYLVADTIYEGYRSGSLRIDPIEMAVMEGRLGPTIELYSISKMIGFPAARLGWMRADPGTGFQGQAREFQELMARIVQPTLGPAPTPFQLALLRLYSEMSEPGARAEYDDFTNQRRIEVIGRVRRLMAALSSIDGITFPPYLLGCDDKPDPGAVNAFYLVFGVEEGIMPRSGLSQARAMADFLIDSPPLPVILATPGDSFLPAALRGKGQEYIRMVALCEKTDWIAESIGRFVQSRK